MHFVQTKNDIIKNVVTLDGYRNSTLPADREFYSELLRRGTCFVIYPSQGRMLIGPSRFVGYQSNSRQSHSAYALKHGTKTNSAISRILGLQFKKDRTLENLYLNFCAVHGITPLAKGSFGADRKFIYLSTGSPSALPTSDVVADLESIQTDPLRGPTEKEILGTARIGQGQFRHDLEHMWKACAVTGFRELPLLRASHIKPWSASTDAERLDPYNGLLLVPNLDVAFDGGYISFLDNGDILISSRLDQAARKIMGIHRNLRLQRVAKKHHPFLEYHRREVFQP